MKSTTFCPLFPGFYGTTFEPIEDSEIYNYNQENNTDLNYDDFEWDYEDYRNRVGKEFVNRCERELNAFLPVKMDFVSIHSPREYNFTNDSINVIVSVSLHKLISLIKEKRQQASQYFIDNFTDRSGFISFHSPNIVDWLKPEYIKENYDFRLGALLECLLWCNIETDDLYFWADTECNIVNYTVIAKS